MLTISNSGNSTLTVSGLTVSGMTVPGGSVYLPGVTGATIPAGQSQQVPITFTATVAQSYDGTLTVNGDQTSGENTIPISGFGVAADIRLLSGQGKFVLCDSTGVCSFSASIQNVGSTCATGTGVVARFYSDSGAQLGSDVQMDASGSLSTRIIRLQEVVPISSLALIGPDVTLNAKAYLLFPTWNNLICP
jgi:hypothetical protein